MNPLLSLSGSLIFIILSRRALSREHFIIGSVPSVGKKGELGPL